MYTYNGVDQAALGNSGIIRIKGNPQQGPGALGLVLTLSPGAVMTCSVQITADQVPTDGGNWNNHDVLVGQTKSANGNIAYPVSGVRVQVTSYTSGSAHLGIAQWP